MATTPDAVVAVVRRDGGYRREFVAAFGREAQWDDVARALASYVRTIRSGNSRNPGLDTIVRPIGLSVEDKRALVGFLRALTGKVQSGR